MLRNKDKSSKSCLKIAVLGEAAVGKTSLVKRYTKNTFSEQSSATIGADRSEKSCMVDNESFHVQILDTAGQQQFQSLIQGYLKTVDAVIFVYDISDKESFAFLPVWNMLLSKCVKRDLVKILVGNKKDLAKIDREVSFKSARTYAEFEGMVALEVSAKEGDSVDLVFQCVLRELKLKQEVAKSKSESKKTFCGRSFRKCSANFVDLFSSLVGKSSEQATIV